MCISILGLCCISRVGMKKLVIWQNFSTRQLCLPYKIQRYSSPAPPPPPPQKWKCKQDVVTSVADLAWTGRRLRRQSYSELRKEGVTPRQGRPIGLCSVYINSLCLCTSSYPIGLSPPPIPRKKRQRIYAAKTGYRKFETNIARNETARPQFQFLHSCFSERFKYSHDPSADSAAGKQVDRSCKSLTETWIWKLGLRPRSFFYLGVRKLDFLGRVGCKLLTWLKMIRSWLTNKSWFDLFIFPKAVFRIRMSRIRYFLSLPNPDPSIDKQKN